MLRKRVIEEFDAVVDWLQGKSPDSMDKIRFNISNKSHQDIIQRLKRMRNLLEPQPLDSWCQAPDRHAPGCQCYGLLP